MNQADSPHRPAALAVGNRRAVTVLAGIAVWQYTHFRTPARASRADADRTGAGNGRSTHARQRSRCLPTVASWRGRRAIPPAGFTCARWISSTRRPCQERKARARRSSRPTGDGSRFFADGKLRKVSLAGGMPVAVAEASQPFGGVWLPDGDIVFAASEHGGLLRVSERGGGAGAAHASLRRSGRSTSQLAGAGAGRTRAALHRRDLAGRRVAGPHRDDADRSAFSLADDHRQRGRRTSRVAGLHRLLTRTRDPRGGVRSGTPGDCRDG